MQIKRRKTKKVRCGSIYIGGDAPIAIQSMTNTDTRNIKETINQIKNLEEYGCEIVRIAIPDMEAAMAVPEIKKNISVPLVADIHFNYRLALKCIENGIDKLRINPGNIGDIQRVKEIVSEARVREIPIRIGVNAGSLEKNIIEQYGMTPKALVESAMNHVRILEDLNFGNIIISLKASDIKLTLDSYKLLSKKVKYPLHIGITEAGTVWRGTIKSAIGIGTLLLNGIGDTLRVSLTGDPSEEVRVGKEILQSLNIRSFGINFISCPTCGRTQIDLVKLTKKIENALKDIKLPITVAVMGCAVNGPGEAREADLGIAGGKNSALLFKKGKIIKKVPEGEIVDAILREVEKVVQND
ncbi:flavodoxin-dependent (E)-4-hydroxy-3-methylbut-2-enyl-diphosphate synthase [Paramaledivibacter caminithermalis]|uniref:4-hydroxy-3-methylbut-2-en-1-yl diphosphate synthase (flavodoxin) n=1 Tax=Paramaledivibacter caminithermalis (strain DSM 15212 / CIP 107654 / DViRD3) TaxID=1121301 RepID=A0A1M6N5Q3_PARC5|nr:flavodoxin-dependent (E)-4-hydroxy-3-methylbut-2-enyl-diphosphate synthase [Paramaledivibacter caminithermalis]SHJ91018.1 4-hydroxy-3-methylbut-2-en-1-yl diphosphate synthase [Paramaledivibacter caminithermalis DSM 15212]